MLESTKKTIQKSTKKQYKKVPKNNTKNVPKVLHLKLIFFSRFQKILTGNLYRNLKWKLKYDP